MGIANPSIKSEEDIEKAKRATKKAYKNGKINKQDMLKNVRTFKLLEFKFNRIPTLKELRSR